MNEFSSKGVKIGLWFNPHYGCLPGSGVRVWERIPLTEPLIWTFIFFSPERTPVSSDKPFFSDIPSSSPIPTDDGWPREDVLIHKICFLLTNFGASVANLASLVRHSRTNKPELFFLRGSSLLDVRSGSLPWRSTQVPGEESLFPCIFFYHSLHIDYNCK